MREENVVIKYFVGIEVSTFIGDGQQLREVADNG